MRASFLALVASGVLAVAGCSERHDSPAATARVDPRLENSLWRFAPTDAVLGMVVADGTLSSSLRSLAEIERVISTIAGGREAISQLRSRLGRRGSFDPFDPRAYATVGIDVDKGAAVFINDEDEPLVVLSLVDRKAFRAFVNAKVETVRGRELDRLPEGAYCVEAQGRYLCAERVAVLDAAMADAVAPLAERYLGLAPSLHGEIEIVAALDRMPRAAGDFRNLRAVVTDVRTAAVAIALSGGRLAVNGWLEGRVAAAIREGAPASSPAALVSAEEPAVFAMGVRIPPPALEGHLPESLPLAGADLRQALFDPWTGDVRIRVTPSSESPGFAVTAVFAMKDTSALAKLARPLCTMASALPGVSAKGSDGECAATIDAADMGWKRFAALAPTLPVTARIGASELRVTLGIPDPAGGSNAHGPVSKDLVKGPWTVAMWGRWADPFVSQRGLGPGLAKDVLASATPEQQLMIQAARILFAHLYETGLGLALEENGIRVAFEITTMAADEAKAYRAYSDLVAASVPTGKAYQDALIALADAHPGSLVAQQAGLAKTGAPTMGSALALGYVLARSPLARFDQASMAAEAPYNLERIEAAVRRYHADTGKLPPSTAMTPPLGECCKSGGKCVPRSAPWHGKGWSELLFELREPHYFSYQYERSGKSFVIRAVGDLDCDGQASTYAVEGRLKGKRIETKPVAQRGQDD